MYVGHSGTSVAVWPKRRQFSSVGGGSGRSAVRADRARSDSPAAPARPPPFPTGRPAAAENVHPAAPHPGGVSAPRRRRPVSTCRHHTARRADQARGRGSSSSRRHGRRRRRWRRRARPPCAQTSAPSASAQIRHSAPSSSKASLAHCCQLDGGDPRRRGGKQRRFDRRLPRRRSGRATRRRTTRRGRRQDSRRPRRAARGSP